MTLQELHDKRGTLVTQARTQLNEINKNTDESRAAELESRHDKIMGEMDALDATIAREERVSKAEKETEARAKADRDARRPGQEDQSQRGADDLVAPEYREVFSRYLSVGVQGMSSEEREILRMGYDAKAGGENRAQSAGTDTAGGYTVPEGFSGEIDMAMAAWGPMWDANIVRELNTTTGNRLPWPTVDDTAQRGETKAENAASTDDGSKDVTFGEKELDAYVYNTGVVRIPMELLTDSAFNMEAILNELYDERLGRTANEVLTTADGAGKPQGIVPAAGAGVTATSATALDADEFIDLIHSVDPAYRASPRCRFMFNDLTLAAIRKLKDGDGNYLWQMGDIRAGEPNTLLDQPYSVNQAMANIATGTSPIIFGDFSRFIVRKVNGFSVMTLRERYAEFFQVGMIGYKRFDSELLNAAAVKKLTMA